MRGARDNLLLAFYSFTVIPRYLSRWEVGFSEGIIQEKKRKKKDRRTLELPTKVPLYVRAPDAETKDGKKKPCLPQTNAMHPHPDIRQS